MSENFSYQTSQEDLIPLYENFLHIRVHPLIGRKLNEIFAAIDSRKLKNWTQCPADLDEAQTKAIEEITQLCEKEINSGKLFVLDKTDEEKAITKEAYNKNIRILVLSLVNAIKLYPNLSLMIVSHTVCPYMNYTEYLYDIKQNQTIHLTIDKNDPLLYQFNISRNIIAECAIEPLKFESEKVYKKLLQWHADFITIIEIIECIMQLFIINPLYSIHMLDWAISMIFGCTKDLKDSNKQGLTKFLRIMQCVIYHQHTTNRGSRNLSVKFEFTNNETTINSSDLISCFTLEYKKEKHELLEAKKAQLEILERKAQADILAKNNDAKNSNISIVKLSIILLIIAIIIALLFYFKIF
jgi:hypothetical protein